MNTKEITRIDIIGIKLQNCDVVKNFNLFLTHIDVPK